MEERQTTRQNKLKMQTCTGCRKQKAPEEFWRYNRTNLTCNACSERHRTRKAKVAAQQTQPTQSAAGTTTDDTTKKEQE